MRYYCGTDIIEVSRIKDAILNTPHFKEKVFTPSEIIYAEKSSDNTKYEHFAGRFAAKEAVYKSISGIYSDLSITDIEILNDKDNRNRPYVIVHNSYINDLMKNGKLLIDVSISHLNDYATANAVATLHE